MTDQRKQRLQIRKKLAQKDTLVDDHDLVKVRTGMSNRAFCLVLCGLGAFLAFVIWLKLNEESWHPDLDSISELYKRLELTDDATEEEIRSQYRKLALKWHPDKNPGCFECPARFAQIEFAHAKLRDASLREYYQELLGRASNDQADSYARTLGASVRQSGGRRIPVSDL
eukprot:TRINITY_DN1649_c0_g1_i5.p1 TRINITY_DN1649_c0_g1~~TRINITY_DN1649_c0_g1_i5.p1  ORF type:complete len:170 (+),score=17.80 TRINITY_DN1649_c0_g1_i5:24-533(+)